MIFIHDIYKFIPTYRPTLSGYPTRETIYQIGVALVLVLNSVSLDTVDTMPTSDPDFGFTPWHLPQAKEFTYKRLVSNS